MISFRGHVLRLIYSIFWFVRTIVYPPPEHTASFVRPFSSLCIHVWWRKDAQSRQGARSFSPHFSSRHRCGRRLFDDRRSTQYPLPSLIDTKLRRAVDFGPVWVFRSRLGSQKSRVQLRSTTRLHLHPRTMHLVVRRRDRIDAIGKLSYPSPPPASSTRTAVRVATVVSAPSYYVWPWGG